MVVEKKNIANQKFGRWTATDVYTELPDKRGRVVKRWLCRCECGTEAYVPELSLIYHRSLSCGCTPKKSGDGNGYDLTGECFGNLTAIRKLEERHSSGNIQWLCRCSCGREYVALSTRLVTGKTTHCSDKKAHREELKYKATDITGRTFQRLTALYPIQKRRKHKGLYWHCRCACGVEVDVSYNSLVYDRQQSCGCQKKEHSSKLGTYLTYVDNTSLEHINIDKLRLDNTTGYRGVYLIKGKYQAKIVFQKKAYHLGTYSNIDDAAEARRRAEEELFGGMTAFYEQWKVKAEENPRWAIENPIHVTVERDSEGRLRLVCLPKLKI